MTNRPSPSPSDVDSSPSEAAAFEGVDWDNIDAASRRFPPERVTLIAGLSLLVILFTYHHQSGETFLLLRWNVGWEDWLVLLALVVLIAYGVMPLFLDPHRGFRVFGRLRDQWTTVVALIVFAGIVVIGAWAILSGYRALIPWEASIDSLQPPVGASTPEAGGGFECVGEVTTRGDTTICHGTWRHPLGTDTSGYKLTELLVMGTRPVVYATLVTLGIVVPLATVVGVAAGYYGGRIDDLLMAYVDMQLSFPALLVYLLFFMFVQNSMAVFLLAFGLLSWGGIARIVRSETLQRREDGYVVMARAVGASPSYIMRRHLVPNVTNSILPAAFQLIAIIILTEAGLSFLGFNPIAQSWGDTIQRGFTRASPVTHWWIAGIPAIALGITVVACKFIGDGLRDALDPRRGS